MSVHRNIKFIVSILICLQIGLVSNAFGLKDVTIEKSPHDERSYRGLLLDNGLKVLLVSDPSAEKAAVALNVAAGSFNEPKQRQGLAHFLEHMLFLGTEKYPDPNEYSKYISEHGGFNNAWTAARNTQYYYSILPQYLPESLDRFAQFFIKPLFNADLVDREKHAVDSEYHLSIKKDGWRINEVNGVTGNPEHPMAQFSVGNLETLSDKAGQTPVREELIEFYKNYYTADRMVLVIIAPQSLDELEKLAQQNFSAVVKHPVKDNKIKTLAYTPKETGQKISIQTLGDYQEISLDFPIPSQQDKYNFRGADYILYLLQQTGPNSLYQFLKDKNWITAMSGSANELTTMQDIVSIGYSLTPEGMPHIDEIVRATFEYIYFLKEIGPQQKIFDELRAAGERNFIYADKTDPADYVATLPDAVQIYPLEKVLRAGNITQDTKFNPAEINQIFEYLTPQNLRLLIATPKVKGNKYEKFYQVNYKVEKFSRKQIAAWNKVAPTDKFKLPPENSFMPEDLTFKAGTTQPGSDEAPQQIISEQGMTIWFKQNKRFKLPSVNILIQLQAPDMNNTPRRTVLGTLMLYSLSDKLSNLRSQFTLAGVACNEDINETGLLLSLNMYSDKMPQVVNAILDYVKDPQINPTRFKAYKDDLKRTLLNFKQQAPFEQAYKILSAIIKQPAWLPEALLPEIDNITAKEVEAYANDFLRKLQVVALINGNATEKDAKAITNTITNNLKIDMSRRQLSPLPKLALLNNATDLNYEFNPHHNDGVIVSYHQCDQQGDSIVANNLLLVDIMDRPLFDELRTKEQLGYVVGINAMRVRQITGVVFYIESSKKQPAFLQQRLEAFLKAFEPKLKAMSAAEFNTYKSSLKNVLLQKPSTLAEETARYWSKISDQTLRFNFEKEIAAEVDKLTIEQVSKLFDSIWVNSKTRRSISVISKSKPLTDRKLITSISGFKAQQQFE
jgi:secreted Zn-dependent insulinase-like peptidase